MKQILSAVLGDLDPYMVEINRFRQQTNKILPWKSDLLPFQLDYFFFNAYTMNSQD